jgi:hypothetical protein
MLEVNITGICAFVETANDLRIVIPNLRQSGSAHGHTIPAHAAFVKFPNNAWVTPVAGAYGPVRPANLIVLEPDNTPTEREQFVLLLDGETIDIRIQTGASVPYGFNAKRLVQMRDIVDDWRIDDSLLGGSLSGPVRFDPSAERVSALMTIAHGTVAAHPEQTDWVEFKPNAKKQYRGDFTESMKWKLSPDRYVFSSRKWGIKGNAPVDQWVFDATQNEILVEIGCLPIEDIIEPDAPRLVAREHADIDHHFHAFYDLLAKPAERHPLPNRVSARPRSKRADGMNCPPAQFD